MQIVGERVGIDALALVIALAIAVPGTPVLIAAIALVLIDPTLALDELTSTAPFAGKPNLKRQRPQVLAHDTVIKTV